MRVHVHTSVHVSCVIHTQLVCLHTACFIHELCTAITHILSCVLCATTHLRAHFLLLLARLTSALKCALNEVPEVTLNPSTLTLIISSSWRWSHTKLQLVRWAVCNQLNCLYYTFNYPHGGLSLWLVQVSLLILTLAVYFEVVPAEVYFCKLLPLVLSASMCSVTQAFQSVLRSCSLCWRHLKLPWYVEQLTGNQTVSFTSLIYLTRMPADDARWWTPQVNVKLVGPFDCLVWDQQVGQWNLFVTLLMANIWAPFDDKTSWWSRLWTVSTWTSLDFDPSHLLHCPALWTQDLSKSRLASYL